jgi:hypothetical protein
MLTNKKQVNNILRLAWIGNRKFGYKTLYSNTN